MGAKRGYRLPKRIVADLRAFCGGNARPLTVLQSPNLDPSLVGLGHSPFALVGAERFAAFNSSGPSPRDARVAAVRANILAIQGEDRGSNTWRVLRQFYEGGVGPFGDELRVQVSADHRSGAYGDSAYDKSDPSRLRFDPHTTSSGDPQLDELREAFGDLMPVVLDTAAVRERAESVYDTWRAGEDGWRRRSLRCRTAIGEELEGQEARRAYLHDVKVDVVFRAVLEKDDVLLYAIRRDADALVSEASLACLDAWYEVEGAALSEARAEKAASARRTARLVAVTGLPAPRSHKARVKEVADLLRDVMSTEVAAAE